VLLTALYAGLRACELSALRWRQIDQVAGAINVEISKGHKGRAVPLHPSLARVLADWRITQELEGDSAPVFSLDGAPICPNRIGKIARRVAQSTGLPLTAHVLRHTFATSGLRGSGNIYAVSKALGHAQLKQTEIYIAASTRDSMPAVAALPDIDSW
jgi:integrase